MIPEEFINNLIALGKRTDLEESSCQDHFQILQPYNRYMVGTWNEWYPVCLGLPIEDHIALLEALVLNEKYAGDYAVDSGSSAIWVYRKLEEKISYEMSFKIACWIIGQSKNPWLPFGNQSDKSYFKEHAYKFKGDFNGTLIQRIHFERNNDHSLILQKEAQTKADRINIKQRNAEERQTRKKLRDIERYSIDSGIGDIADNKRE